MVDAVMLAPSHLPCASDFVSQQPWRTTNMAAEDSQHTPELPLSNCLDLSLIVLVLLSTNLSLFVTLIAQPRFCPIPTIFDFFAYQS